MNSKRQTKRSGIWLVLVLAILAGTGVGGAAAIINYQSPEMQVAGHDVDSTKQLQIPVDVAKPRAFVPNGMEHDFGMMARGETRSHSFQVRNIGNGELTLKVLDTTCKCTVGSLEKESIASGETVDVTLTWEAKSYDREFRQSATIETNDRTVREITLSVFGKVVQLAMPDIPMIQFNRVSRSETQSFSTPIYGFRDTDLLITGHEFLYAGTADFFDVQVRPLPKEEWTDPRATSGLMCTIEIKPGLPVGEVRQGIRLRTNKKDIPPMELSIEMNIVSDISVVGPGYKTDKNLLVWGGAASKEVDNKKTMYLIVKGPHKDRVVFSVAEADPAGVLTAEFGEPVDMKRMVDGKEKVVARRFPMDVIIKKGSEGVQRMGSKQGPFGVLTLNTNHPEIDEYVIKVRFFVR